MVRAGCREDWVHKACQLNSVLLIQWEKVNQDLSLQGPRVQEDHTIHEKTELTKERPILNI